MGSVSEKSIQVECLVVGAGLSGICFAYYAKQKGIDYRVIESNSSFGGTWYVNNFPNLTTDVPYPNYSFSFSKLEDMSLSNFSLYKNRDEMLNYMSNIITKNELDDGRFIYNTKVLSAIFNKDHYEVHTTNGKYIAKFLIVACGAFGLHKTPVIRNSDKFKGELLHAVDLSPNFSVKGKRICIIGNGATSLQLVEIFAKEADALKVICSSPRIFSKKPSHFEAMMFLRLNFVNFRNRAELMDFWDNFGMNSFSAGLSKAGIKKNKKFGNLFSGSDTYYNKLFGANKDEREFIKLLRSKNLVPSFCSTGHNANRIMFYTSYHKDVLRSNVQLLNTKIEAFSENGIITKDGAEIIVDTIIMATGYGSLLDWPFFELQNGSGVKINNDEKVLMQDYYGIMNCNFPNLCSIYGVGSNINHVDAVTACIEPQVKCITSIISKCLKTKNFSRISVKKDKFQKFHTKVMQARKAVQKRNEKYGIKPMNNYLYINGVSAEYCLGNFINYRHKLENLVKNFHSSDTDFEIEVEN